MEDGEYHAAVDSSEDDGFAPDFNLECGRVCCAEDSYDAETCEAQCEYDGGESDQRGSQQRERDRSRDVKSAGTQDRCRMLQVERNGSSGNSSDNDCEVEQGVRNHNWRKPGWVAGE